MRGGDISASPAPRLVFVWEGLIARLPDPGAVQRCHRAMRKKRWEEAVSLYVTNASASARIMQVYWDHDFGMDLATFLDPGIKTALRERIDSERLPFGWILTETPDGLAHRCGWDKGIARVYDANDKRVGRYGQKGRFVPDPAVANLLA